MSNLSMLECIPYNADPEEHTLSFNAQQAHFSMKISVLQSIIPGKNVSDLTEFYPLLVQWRLSRATVYS